MIPSSNPLGRFIRCIKARFRSSRVRPSTRQEQADPLVAPPDRAKLGAIKTAGDGGNYSNRNDFRPRSLLAADAPQLLVRADEQLPVGDGNRGSGQLAERVTCHDVELLGIGPEDECLAGLVDGIDQAVGR